MADRTCPECERGREACQYCETVTERDWEAMCDCGLYDFGAHLLKCEDRAAFKYVIASDHDTAEARRDG